MTRRRARGFTVLELLVAILLCAVLAGAALLGYRRMLAGWRLNAAARQIVMDLKIARARALSSAATHRLRFVVPGSVYRQERRRAGSYYPVSPPVPLPPDIEIVGCTGAGSGISFTPRGSAGAFGTVQLRNAEGEQRSVVVDIVGRLRVQ